MNYPYEKDWWETKDHKKIKICDMETSHIKNTINYLKEHPTFYDEEFYFSGFEPDDFYYDYIDNSKLVDKKIEELQYELDKRTNKTKTYEEGFIAGFSHYIKAVEELEKRIKKAIEFIDQELQYHLQPFEYKQVDNDINILIGILQGGSNE